MQRPNLNPREVAHEKKMRQQFIEDYGRPPSADELRMLWVPEGYMGRVYYPRVSEISQEPVDAAGSSGDVEERLPVEEKDQPAKEQKDVIENAEDPEKSEIEQVAEQDATYEEEQVAEQDATYEEEQVAELKHGDLFIPNIFAFHHHYMEYFGICFFSNHLKAAHHKLLIQPEPWTLGP